MEILQGKRSSTMDAAALAGRLNHYENLYIDIGTGDGRYVRHMARHCHDDFVIGVDACRENLHDASRRAPSNALFVIANAQRLPCELHDLATHVTINFPWGSLLEGLLDDDPALLAGLVNVARPGARMEVHLNAGALNESGVSLEAGANRVRDVLRAAGFAVRPPVLMMAQQLKSVPTTWARRLAFGRDPRGVYLAGSRN